MLNTINNPDAVILQHNKVVNGIIKIKIVNLDNIYDTYHDNFIPQLSLSYRFHLTGNNMWQSSTFTFCNINSMGEFFVRIPLFLLSYSFEYKLIITCRQPGVIDDNIPCMRSSNYAVTVPSFTMESSFNEGDTVNYISTKNLGISIINPGVISEIFANGDIKIKNSATDNIVTVQSSQILLPTIYNKFVIDLTNRNQADIDLLLKTNNKQCVAVYNALLNGLNNINPDIVSMEEDDEATEMKSMNRYLSINICDFLYGSEYNYKIKCIFGDGHLNMQQTWKYVILEDYKRIAKACDIENIQSIQDCDGYSCTVCRTEMNWSDYMFYCQCSKRHDICVSCVHSLVLQQNEMKPFILELLQNKLDTNCIEEIVSFCVATVNIFNIHNQSNHI